MNPYYVITVTEKCFAISGPGIDSGSRYSQFEDAYQARVLVTSLNYAYDLGTRDAKTKVRELLGIKS